MKRENLEQLLKKKGLKVTQVRMALLKHFIDMEHAQSYSDIQGALAKEVDKSTMYRNLTSFEREGIIHRIDDHTGIAKYAFGKSSTVGKDHAHFVCECCETVYCMEDMEPVELQVPAGFKTNQVQTVVRGICADC